MNFNEQLDSMWEKDSRIEQLEAELAENAELENEKRIAHSWGMVLTGQNMQLKDENAAQAKRIAELQDVIEHLGKVSDICTKLYTKKVCANCRCKESQKGTE